MLRPNFDPSVNWTSKLRKRARYCIGFEKVTPYKETEISDIRVKDTQGIISRWLHCLGYRPAKAWAGRSVTYYVEVKTTIRDSSAPFKMSVGQMEHVSLHLAAR